MPPYECLSYMSAWERLLLLTVVEACVYVLLNPFKFIFSRYFICSNALLPLVQPLPPLPEAFD